MKITEIEIRDGYEYAPATPGLGAVHDRDEPTEGVLFLPSGGVRGSVVIFHPFGRYRSSSSREAPSADASSAC